ncbi:MAG TPA: DNA methyltransferase [Pyrinomonadaceae bacterium]|nr:DNA methyltransferase [Pyrinomonadaceae bacterium]
MAKAKANTKKTVETFLHDEATRKNIPTAEYESVVREEDKTPIRVAYERRNRDLDPQLVWRGKDEQDWSDLVVQAPPLYIQEKVHPKVLIDDLRRRTERTEEKEEIQNALFADLYSAFNGIDEAAKTDFYQHDQNWSNRMILGDSLQVMASLAEREGLRGQVQCIYIDPPYGIKFNSNFQWSTTDKAGTTSDAADKISREPEQVKAFRDTWRDGVHSYLTYLRDRLTVSRDLLTESGTLIVQIGDENLHLVRSLLDEVFGTNNFLSLVTFRKKNMPFGARHIEGMVDYLVWYAKDATKTKFRWIFKDKDVQGASRWDWVRLEDGASRKMSAEEFQTHSLLPPNSEVFTHASLKPSGYSESMVFDFDFIGRKFKPPGRGCWTTTQQGMNVLAKADRIGVENTNLRYRLYLSDYSVERVNNLWSDTSGASNKTYVVQTMEKVIQRCLLMATDPGDLVLDPTCGSGTTAYVAEQWGRRWITIDTSRVALALARARIMGARYPYYLLADSEQGKRKEWELRGTTGGNPNGSEGVNGGEETPSLQVGFQPTYNNLRHGFVYERVPHITLKSIANNTEIDVIYEKWQETLEPLREEINKALGKNWQEWEIPRELATEHTEGTEAERNDSLRSQCSLWLKSWWEARIARQKEIDASIAAKAEFEYLYDKPYDDKRKVRVAGPFTVESLSPHRTLGVDENDELIDPAARPETGSGGSAQDFTSMILENLKLAGVQQAHKEDKITFTNGPTGWPGHYVCAEARYDDTGGSKRAAIFIGPEFGTVSRSDLVAAAREAGDAGFDVLIACAFNYDAHSSEFDKLGRVPVLKARMNADLHMADDLKNTGKGNLFVIFGEPDIDIYDAPDEKIQVKVKGVDVFDPKSGEVRSDGADGIACWFIDTDYNEESFFVRHAYFLGQNDPYKSLKTSLKAEINEEAWSTLNSDTSRPFKRPDSGRIAVKVINHLGDEVMKVFRV